MNQIHQITVGMIQWQGPQLGHPVVWARVDLNCPTDKHLHQHGTQCIYISWRFSRLTTKNFRRFAARWWSPLPGFGVVSIHGTLHRPVNTIREITQNRPMRFVKQHGSQTKASVCHAFLVQPGKRSENSTHDVQRAGECLNLIAGQDAIRPSSFPPGCQRKLIVRSLNDAITTRINKISDAAHNATMLPVRQSTQFPLECKQILVWKDTQKHRATRGDRFLAASSAW
mmetsp:Transcript_30334/g.72731  ORF Transcript_30334/g.72731 Transcript_30334/m.72731 type:complete len:227 (+) Transcript_30334:296-976(+)